MKFVSRLVGLLLASWVLGVFVMSQLDGTALAPVDGDIGASFLATGDTGHQARPLAVLIDGQHAVGRALRRAHLRRPADALILLGDNFYMEGLRREEMVARIRDNLVRPYCGLIEFDGDLSPSVAADCGPAASKAPRPPRLFAVLGNHDTEAPESAALQHREVPRYVSNWQLPAGVVELHELEGGVSLILLLSEKRRNGDDLRALSDALRKAKGPWRILATHRPVVADQGHYGKFIREAIGDAGVPVHAMLAGHIHSLRLIPGEFPDPALQVVTGSGSRAREPLYPVEGAVASRVALGYSRIDIVRRGGAEELVVSLVSVPRLPVLSFLGERLVARWAVDLLGRTRAIEIASE